MTQRLLPNVADGDMRPQGFLARLTVGKGNTLKHHERSDVGRKRSNNQDSFAIVPAKSPAEYRSHGWLLIVADGMGAHVAGEEASRIAATRVPELYTQYEPQRSPPLALRKSLQRANREIHRQGEQDAAYRGMGTTCSALVLLPRGALVGHVGDSRIYRIRGSSVEQLSRDHSLAWEVAAAAGHGGEDGTPAVPKNIITRSMGPHDEVEVDLEGPFPIEAGDQFVLCSDGLSGTLRDEEIAMLAASLPPEEATAALIGLALIRGAPDNTTVLVATAGPEEVSRYSRRDAAWPLDTDGTTAAARNRPWILMGVAAVSLFVAMLISPWSDFGKSASPEFRTYFLFGSVVGLGLALGCLVASFASFMAPPAKRIRTLPPGKQLGKGPYRSYDATPTSEQFAGLFNSLEAAAEEVAAVGDTAGRDDLRGALANCRDRVAAGDFGAAIREAARGISVFTAHIEAGRDGDRPVEPTPSEAS